LDDVYEGINKDLNINIRKYCLKCNKKCGKCDGRGIIQQIRSMGFMQQIFQGSCDNCEGSGITIEGKADCKQCSGKGCFNEDKKATLIIPKGIDENYKTAFPELGEQPRIASIKPGDLIIHIKIEEHRMRLFDLSSELTKLRNNHNINLPELDKLYFQLIRDYSN
jgi:DnaJ-class molecular chaperone